MRYQLLASIADEINALLDENERLREKVDHLEKLKAITDDHLRQSAESDRRLTGEMMTALLRGCVTSSEAHN